MKKKTRGMVLPSFNKWAKRQKKTKEYRAGMQEAHVLLMLAALREKKRLSQRMLAQKIGMKQSQLARIEGGGQNVTLSTLTRLASFFGKRVELV